MVWQPPVVGDRPPPHVARMSGDWRPWVGQPPVAESRREHVAGIALNIPRYPASPMQMLASAATTQHSATMAAVARGCS